MKRILALILVFSLVIGFAPMAKAEAKVRKKQVVGTWEAWKAKGEGISTKAKDIFDNFTLCIRNDGTITVNLNGKGSDGYYKLTKKGILIDNQTEAKLKKGKLYVSQDGVSVIFKRSTGVKEDGIYTAKDDVALYIHTYNKLPSNFITKKEAQALGWQGGGLEPYLKNGCIGGDYFGNYEGQLPKAEGRDYYECDIDTLKSDVRGAKRIVYSNDGLIFYTEDHYESFVQLYPKKG